MSPISQDSIHSHETKVKRHIVYGVGCIILDKNISAPISAHQKF